MLLTLLSWFRPPVFPQDEYKTRSALLLNVVLNIFLIALPVLIIGAILGGNVPRLERVLTIATLAWLTIFGTKLIMHFGRVAEAGIVTVVIIYMAATLTIYTLGTIRAPITSFYFLAIVLSGLVISRRAIIWMTGISSVTIITFIVAERNGWLPLPTLTVTVTQGVTFTVTFTITAILLYLAITRIDEALAHARAELIQRQQVEEKLRESEEMYRSLFDNVQVGVALTGNGKVLKYNETMLRQSGYSKDDIEKLENVSEFYFDSDDQQRILEIITNQGLVKELPIRFKRKDGTPYDTLLWMTPTTINGERYLQCVVQDVTERKQAEQALRDSEEKYRTLFESANDAIMLFDRTTAKIIHVNQTACHLYGYSLDEFLQLSVQDISAEVQATTIAIHGGTTHIPLRYHKKRDGTIFPVEITAAHFTLAYNPVQVGFIRDITERIRAEREREQYIEELGRQNAELERFTYSVSHDLRNPLVTIKGFLGALENDLRNGRTDRLQNDFQRISGAADKMHLLLAELLELSRVGRIINPPEEIDLSRLINDALDNLDARLHQKKVDVTIASNLPKLYGDRIRLREVLENLIDNAVKYMGAQPNPQLEIGVRHRENIPIVFVKDNGIGIEPRYQDRIFGLFEKLDPTVEGTGIGLALVKRIVETHGGKIWVESEGLGQGSTFCFTIPNGK